LSFFATPNTALIEYITYHLPPRCFSIVLQSLLLPSGSTAITVCVAFRAIMDIVHQRLAGRVDSDTESTWEYGRRMRDRRQMGCSFRVYVAYITSV
jgi:hypothetical protein